MAKLLPPDSTELKNLGFSIKEREIYGLLYDWRGTPLTMREIREVFNVPQGEQEHLNRRMRELYREFDIVRKRKGREMTYELKARLDQPKSRGNISKKLRAYVLRNQRCEQCGKTPREHRVVLHVDHKIPKAWGGTDDPDNLQALCAECNEGKRHYYATFNRYSAEIKQAVAHDEPHRRIGELLMAFRGAPVRSDLIERVASAKQYQDDWQKRLRELRLLGWKIKASRRKEGGRVVAYYELVHSEPWPPGNIGQAIRRLEGAKRRSKKAPATGASD